MEKNNKIDEDDEKLVKIKKNNTLSRNQKNKKEKEKNKENKILKENEKKKPKLSKRKKRELEITKLTEQQKQEIESQGFQLRESYTQNNNNFNYDKNKIKDVNKYKSKPLLKNNHKIPTDLPIIKLLSEIEESVKNNQVTIVKAATGSGKSLGIPPYFVDKGMLVRVSLPTIPATLGLFRFVRDNSFFKENVGYSCYGDVCYDRMNTKLAFCTTKHLINDLKLVLNGTRNLPKNFLLMIDEAHHTSTENKAILKLALYMIKKGFDIKLLIASATLGDMNFSSFKSKTIQSVGRLHPITIHWNDKDIDPVDMKKAVIHTVDKILEILTKSQESGDNNGILVFVPGEAEVETIAAQLESMKTLNLQVFRLYSNMPSEEIMDAFLNIPENTTKVVISTNIGESSITIPDICKVVDMGLQKTPYDNKIGMKLITEFAPKDKLTQRKGRAGRTSPGDYYPMFTEKKWEELKDTDLSDMDRMMPYMIVLEFLDAGLNAQEILEIEDFKYKPLIEKLIKLGLIDQNNKITDLGHAVPHYPFSLENAIVAYRSMDFIYNNNKIGEHVERDDPVVVAILIIISMLEGSQGNSFFWIPKEYRKTQQSKQLFMNQKYKYFRGDTDFVTFINIFSGMMQDSKGRTNYSYLQWAQESSFNNKLLSNVRKHFKRLVEITYNLSSDLEIGSVEKQLFKMLENFYGITDLTQLTHPNIMNKVYSLFEDVYIDCQFEEPTISGKKKELHYHSQDGTKYKIDGLRSFSKMEEAKMHRIVALQIIETRSGMQTSRFISCLFPSQNQTTKKLKSNWETDTIESDLSLDDIDFSVLEEIADL